MERSSVAAGATVPGPDGAVPVSRLEPNDVVIRLLFTTNHLSRWLSPIHNDVRLVRSPRRSEPSVKDLVLELRDREIVVFAKLYAIATQNRPDLDRLPPLARTPAEARFDQEAPVLEVMAEFRRLRQSTGSLLRSLLDDAWARDGLSRREGDTTIRRLADGLVESDLRLLRQIDHALDASGAREGIAAVSRVHLDALLRLAT